MKILIAAFALLILVACNSSGENEKNITDTATPAVSNEVVTATPIEINAVKLSSNQVPPNLKFRGKLQEAWQWKDKLGNNILITTVVAPYPDKPSSYGGDDAVSSELHAFHFIKKETAYKLLWKLSDAEKSCPFDITAAFTNNATTVTDLDKDGIAETTVQYKLACRSDVSPAYMKLIMHEDTLKYSLRGLMCEPGTPDKKFCVTGSTVNLEKQPPAKEEWEEYTRRFGRYETEKEFAGAPPEFLQYARNQWLKYVFETFE